MPVIVICAITKSTPHKITVFIIIVKSPRVSKIRGKDMNFKIGLTKKFTSPNTVPTIAMLFKDVSRANPSIKILAIIIAKELDAICIKSLTI